MIGRIRGQLLAVEEGGVLVEVHGVGYEVDVTTDTLSTLPAVGQEVCLHTHLVVREDAQALFGFARLAERDLFRALIRVNGVGPRLALTLLSGLSADDLACCVRDKDVDRLVKVPGLGRKKAERLVLELKDRLGAFTPPAGVVPPPKPDGTRAVLEEAERALIRLGYRPVEASRAVDDAYAPERTTEEVVRIALKRMAAPSEARTVKDGA